MDYTTLLAKTVQASTSSSIRELLKLMREPGFISLAGGAPDEDLFPITNVAEFANTGLKEEGKQLLQYGITEGLPKLREAMPGYLLKQKNLSASIENIIISTGAQNAIDSVVKMLVDPGDKIVVESPSFLASLKAFSLLRADMLPITLQEDGINIEQLEKYLAENKIKFFYTIPNFQNPTGITTGLEKRKMVIELAKKYDFLILEDDPYYELRYKNENIPTYYELAPEHTIYIGSFSKTISPGLRLGYAVAHPELITKMVNIRQVNDVHTPNLTQYIAYKFIETGLIYPQIEKVQALYREKLELMQSLLAEKVDIQVKFTNPDGGMFIWGNLPAHSDFEKFNKLLLEQKVATVPGYDFFVKKEDFANNFRLNFTKPSKEEISTGINILASVISQL